MWPLYIPPLDATNANDPVTLTYCECVCVCTYWCVLQSYCVLSSISLLLAIAYFFSSSLSALCWRTSVLSAFKHHCHHPCALMLNIWLLELHTPANIYNYDLYFSILKNNTSVPLWLTGLLKFLPFLCFLLYCHPY